MQLYFIPFACSLAARIVMSVIHSLAIRARAGAPRAELETIAADCIALLS